ncbi:uncharacterized protein [Physcomitrium patens]|uniref:Helicase ATP-binding domain-containing protein n=2 Tax=Physcomitrium patens TaxID=3218 RepID=A0A7I4E2X2_PHYPA|nr:uncharacterized ATP-dependent helicase C29A10.10c-like isoform X2 [Physcomitrium patens]|eukprot:XP_024378072.1 uncharacterized ATP-dependent helicase C29A10.10c-like isoform X2 [Physcomitrella patens]
MRDLEIEKALNVEKALLELVKSRQEKVKRLQRELEVLRAHKKFLSESLSVPTFPRGYDPVTGCIEGAAVVPECLIGDDATEAGHVNDMSSARVSKHRKLPASTGRNEVESADEAEKSEEVLEIQTRNSIPTETLSSSTSDSSLNTSRNAVDWSRDDGVDLLKDKVRRERPGVKSFMAAPAKPNGISAWIPEKSHETDNSSDGDSESSDEESSGEEDSASGSEESGDSDDDSKPGSKNNIRKTKPADSNREEVGTGEIFSSSVLEGSTKQKPRPLRKDKNCVEDKSVGIAKTTWKPKIKSSSSSSENSEESSSSSDDDTGKNNRHAQTRRVSLGQAKESKASKDVFITSLPPHASSEDRFDWMVLGLQGPWLPLSSHEKASGGSELIDQSSLPLNFPSTAVYVAMYQKLIVEEAKATLLSDWEQYQAEKGSKTQAMIESATQDPRGQSSVWQLRSMVETMGDPFHYFEAECVEGPRVKFETGEFLCMIEPISKKVKAVAIVNHQDRNQAPLLRSRIPRDCSISKCVLLRLCSMVTVRRMFLAVSTVSEVFSPLQQQIMDPLSNLKFLKSSAALESSLGNDPKGKLSSESLRNFRDRKVLNTLQLLTISSLLHMSQGFQLVQGPPGTGKTSTIVGMVSTLLIEQPGVRILVCAPSNAALDEVAVRLTHCMVDKFGNTYSPMDGTVVRFGSKKVMHSLAQVISLDNLALRLSSSSRCSRSWVDILDGASVVCATLSGCGNCTFDELEKMFDIVIIDEAAQAVEAEVLIALKRVRGRCVLVGDPKQLPATVFQRPSTAYGRSLFERFQGAGVPVHMLTTQYRMHPSICCYPSQQFYGGALRDSTRTSSMQSIFRQEVCREGINIRGCKFRLGHYYFMDVGWGIEREEIVGHSRANFEEALVVCNVVEGVVKGLLSGLKPNLGVITPYIAQRSEIEGQLERRGIDGTACEVNTVDGFQGREKDVIVLSCVRAMADRGLGFVSDERRMNVALTRAKFSLIIVGHAETLQKWSATWGLLIDDARKRGCYQVLSNCSIQAKSARSWKQRPHPGTDVHGMVEEDTQKPSSSSRNSKREVENNAGAKPSGGDLEATNKTVEKSFTVKREVNLTEDNPGVAVHSKKKSKKRNVNESSSILKKQKVVSDVAEPSVMKRPHKLEELEQESPAIQKKKKTKPVVFCLPSLYSVSQSDLTPSARSLEVPIRKIKEEIIDSLPKFSSERKVGAVSASEVPGLISVKKEEEVENEAIFSAPNAFECRNPLMCDETPANPIPRGIGNRCVFLLTRQTE